ncbi:MAG: PilC/PilY family type IV pilus protein [Myxococcota bacterium]
MTFYFKVDTAADYYPYFLIDPADADDDTLNWGIDWGFIEGLSLLGSYPGNWAWHRGTSSVRLDPGEYVFNVWMRRDGQKLDKILLVNNGAFTPVGAGPTELCAAVCTQQCTTTCTAQAIGNPFGSPVADEWPECGVGANRKCCEVQTDINGDGTPEGAGEFFCADRMTACPDDPITGETWSKPTVGRVKIAGNNRWLAFFGSGYNNRELYNVGRAVYALDALSGEQLGRWDLGELLASGSNPSTIDNTTPGGINLVDVDDDTFADRVYFGDLEGRLWKIDVSADGEIEAGTIGDPLPVKAGLLKDSVWPACVVFDAGDPDGDGTRTWAPIITTPAIAVMELGMPNIYFGTGGDDRAPDTGLNYRFYSVRDTDANGTCMSTPLTMDDLSIAQLEWVLGDGKKNTPDPNNAAPLDNANDEGAPGERYWTDPLLVDNVAFFASLPGKIESVDPCEATTGVSRIFGIALTDFTDASGQSHSAGESIFGAGCPFIDASSKIRTGPIAAKATQDSMVRPGQESESAGTRVIFPGLDGSATEVMSPGVKSGTRFKILRWRELPL